MLPQQSSNQNEVNFSVILLIYLFFETNYFLCVCLGADEFYYGARLQGCLFCFRIEGRELLQEQKQLMTWKSYVQKSFILLWSDIGSRRT